MKRFSKKHANSLLRIIGQHLERYNILMIIFLSIIVFAVVCFVIASIRVDTTKALTREEIAYYIAQSILIFASITYIVHLILNKKKIVSDYHLALVHHIYIFFLIAWATISFCFELSLGFSTLLYLIIATLIAGIFVCDPIFFLIVEFISVTIVIVAVYQNPNLFFEGKYLRENMVNFAVFMILIAVIAFRNYRVTVKEFRESKQLEYLSFNDQLTGLLNERSYVSDVEDLNKIIDEGQDVNFAVIFMDLNNLKATNDKYGHRYGCSLVVHCGEVLKKIFKTSDLYHIGGDEFVAIVYDDDLANIDQLMKTLDDNILYRMYLYEGQYLVFSVARGLAIREKGQRYNDVLAAADSRMYEHKKQLKEKYKFPSR